MRILEEALTFDDVLLVPAYSEILPREVDLSTRVTRRIRVNVPLMSAAMDTVTEARLAITIAQEGGKAVKPARIRGPVQILLVERLHHVLPVLQTSREEFDENGTAAARVEERGVARKAAGIYLAIEQIEVRFFSQLLIVSQILVLRLNAGAVLQHLVDFIALLLVARHRHIHAFDLGLVLLFSQVDGIELALDIAF